MPVEVHSRLIKSGGQKLILSAIHDITERKRTEEELRQTSEKLRRAMEGTINAVALTTELRDPYTAGHQHRVAQLACAIARELAFLKSRLKGYVLLESCMISAKYMCPLKSLANQAV